ncbi:carbohydrate sulfotransferase 1-like [Ylistrum balloti]|uniref:carbohydrate sulfotransferase 1-like n=1 Tax=Ylistrum balloti TaxID=509963 RepID=UPI002905ED8C|nr:carbohydrate sulfotransferase 1-like [Ylistrum balloti]
MVSYCDNDAATEPQSESETELGGSRSVAVAFSRSRSVAVAFSRSRSVDLADLLFRIIWLIGFNGKYEIGALHRSGSPTFLVLKPIEGNSDILLIGYLRGGTTFTGEILGLREGNFYMYEPLHKWSTWDYYKPGYSCSLENEHCTMSTRTDSFVMDILRGLYKCDSNHLLKSLQMWQLLKGRGFRDSIQNPTWANYFPECHGKVEGCIEKVISRCANATARVSKVPRVSVSLAAQLLNSVPNLKIIHLVRDPRAIMASRHALKWTPAPGGSISLCNKMKEDYLESYMMRTTHPGRLLTVFYEDLVTNPAKTVQMMFDFAGYNFDEKEQNRLKNMTGMTTKNILNSETRGTSLRIALAWRKRVNETFLNVMNPGCNDLYKFLGYPPLKTNIDLYNSSIPLRISN